MQNLHLRPPLLLKINIFQKDSPESFFLLTKISMRDIISVRHKLIGNFEDAFLSLVKTHTLFLHFLGFA